MCKHYSIQMYNFSARLSSVLPVLIRIARDFLRKNLTPVVIYDKINFHEVFMKLSILIDMLFDLLSKRKVTAAYFAEKYDVSPRTVYRYVELLSKKLPLFIKRGRNGGICLSDSYRLPVGFMTLDEYTATIDALITAYTVQPEQRFLDARRKLSAQVKREKQNLTLLSESGEFILEEPFPSFAEKTRVLENCIRDAHLVEIDYLTENGQTDVRKIEPHALVLVRNVWHVYAFCHSKREFFLFPLGRITALSATEVSFRKRPFQWTPLTSQEDKQFSVRLEINEKALDKAYRLLGAENIAYLKGKWIAELSLPDNETALQLLMNMSADVKVISPPALKEKLLARAKEIVKLYH